MGFRHARNAGPQVGACLAVLWWAGVGGCNATASRAKVSLESPDPSVRVLAIVRAADRDDHSAVPLLVDRLEDEDAAVRLYAILALDRLTGVRLGYRYEAASVERRAGVERWRRYLSESWKANEAVETPATP